MSHEFSRPRTHLDLFSGIGGFALAASWTGWQTIAFAENEPYPCGILSRRFPEIPNLGDVTKLCRRLHDCERIDDDLFWCPRCDVEFGECACIGTDQFLDEIGWPELVTGGIPCQPASLIGERRGTADERWLWPDTLRIMGQLRPRFGLFENPPAILNLESGRAFNGILSGLAALGYDVLWECIPAAVLGAGHLRERIWIFAADSDRSGLERYAGHGEVCGRPGPHRPVAAPDLRARKITGQKWYAQSGIQPVVDGLPSRLARQQLTAIGNALVPQIPALLLNVLSQL
jgi:DNA (cytosine-5)-methyltransferase 1